MGDKLSQEIRETLIVDLCSRIPYGVVVHEVETNRDYKLIGLEAEGAATLETLGDIKSHCYCGVDSFRPYLFPIDFAMIEELRREYDRVCVLDYMCVDFYNKYHIDYRDLISSGAAIEITLNNNPYTGNLWKYLICHLKV